MKAHIASPPYRIAQEVEHCDTDSAAEADIRVGEGVRQHRVTRAHQAEDEGCGKQQDRRKDAGKRESQEKSVEDKFVGPLTLSRSQRARDRGRNTGAHTAVGGLQNEHEPGEGKRGTGKCISPEPSEKETVESDHAEE